MVVVLSLHLKSKFLTVYIYNLWRSLNFQNLCTVRVRIPVLYEFVTSYLHYIIFEEGRTSWCRMGHKKPGNSNNPEIHQRILYLHVYRFVALVRSVSLHILSVCPHFFFLNERPYPDWSPRSADRANEVVHHEVFFCRIVRYRFGKYCQCFLTNE